MQPEEQVDQMVEQKFRDRLVAAARLGGRARWKNRTAEERQAHARKMVLARLAKRKQQILEKIG